MRRMLPVIIFAGLTLGYVVGFHAGKEKKSLEGKNESPPTGLTRFIISRPNGEHRKIERFNLNKPSLTGEGDLSLADDDWYVEIDGQSYTAAPMPR